MEIKKLKLIVGISVGVIVLGMLLYLIYKNNSNIPENYIAVFYGGSGELAYATYIYKIDNGYDNLGFRYINTTSIAVSHGETKLETKITGRGKVTWTDEVFTVAKENNSYSCVRMPNDSKVYSIEEFMGIFTLD